MAAATKDNMPLGRYRSRYGELRTIGTNDTDLATARFGAATVSCWTCEKDRQWGTFGRHSQNAAVMHFQMQALPGTDDCQLSHFELDLSFSSVMEGRCIPALTRCEGGAGGQHDGQAEVCLIGPPAPKCFSHDAPLGTHQNSCWKFWSSRISDDATGQPLAARWMWEAKDNQELKGRILHGGVAIRHPGSPFLVTCHVRGRVTKPNGIKLKFSDKHHVPRPWTVRPDVCDQDLQDHIDKLDANIQRLNKPEMTPLAPCVDRGHHQSHYSPSTYGFNVIGGGARVIMGNASGDLTRSLFEPEPI